MTSETISYPPASIRGLSMPQRFDEENYLDRAGWCYVPVGPGLPSVLEQKAGLEGELRAMGEHLPDYFLLQEWVTPYDADYLSPYAMSISQYTDPGDHVYMLRSVYRALPKEHRDFIRRWQANVGFYILLLERGLSPERGSRCDPQHHGEDTL